MISLFVYEYTQQSFWICETQMNTAIFFFTYNFYTLSLKSHERPPVSSRSPQTVTGIDDSIATNVNADLQQALQSLRLIGIQI